MGRNCGWLTAYSAFLYRRLLDDNFFIPELGINRKKWDIHAIYIPEVDFNLNQEKERLNKVMDKFDCVNIFLSEGAGINNIISEKKKHGENHTDVGACYAGMALIHLNKDDFDKAGEFDEKARGILSQTKGTYPLNRNPISRLRPKPPEMLRALSKSLRQL